MLNTIYIDLQGSTTNHKRSSIIALSMTLVDAIGKVTSYYYNFKPTYLLTAAQEKRTGYSNAYLREKSIFVDVLPEILNIIGAAQLHFYDAVAEQLWRYSVRALGLPIYKCQAIFERILKRSSPHLLGYSLQDVATQLDDDRPFLGSGHNSLHVQHCFEVMSNPAFAKAKPTHFSDTSQDLPSTPGVYYFQNIDGVVIYVGKAINLKKRIKSHFSSKLAFEKALCSATQDVTFEETGNELIALLKESQDIHDLQPQFNTQQIAAINPWVIVQRKDSKGVLRLQAEEKSYADSHHSMTFNRASALQKLKHLQLMYNLCSRYIGLERVAGSCTSPLCFGVCSENESVTTYNVRVVKAYSALCTQKESFYISLKGRTSHERSFVLVIDNLYCGYGYIENTEQISSIEDIEAFLIPQSDTYFSSRSILKYISKKHVEKIYLEI